MENVDLLSAGDGVIVTPRKTLLVRSAAPPRPWLGEVEQVRAKGRKDCFSGDALAGKLVPEGFVRVRPRMPGAWADSVLVRLETVRRL
jgi:hypothetical protein